MQETTEQRRKTRILMEIALAGEKLEDVISMYGDEIDQQMIDILDERTKASRR